ncbi:MAG TPA: chemotaxis protein CheB, partial [Caldimonas sp.]|nr:chemotaxis protein CheB [Caldimonas sp.]
MNQLDPDRADETVGAHADDVIPATGYGLVSTVGLGGSAGSIQALQSFFQHVEPGSGLAYVVVIHLAREHESHLAEVLQRSTSMPVMLMRSPVEVEPDHVYVVP